jgi:hypothetical protein
MRTTAPTERKPDAPGAAPGAPTGPSGARPGPAVTWRAVLLGLLLIPLNSYWVVQMEIIRYSAHPTTISLFFNLLFILFVLVLLNSLIARFFPRFIFRRGELLVVYAMLAIGSTLCSHDMYQVLVPMLAWPWRFATASNGWERDFMHLLPRGVMVPDTAATNGYFLGNSSLYTAAHLRAWLVPVLAWSGFTVTMLFVMLCLSTILRKQWTERERLTYPIAQLPLELTVGVDEGRLPPVFRDRLFAIGFALAGTVDIVNGLNLYYPWIPSILTPGFGQSYLDLHQFFQAKPLSAMGWTPVSWYPFMIGLGVLLPLDFLFSAWFFYLFWKLEQIVVVAMAWDQDPRFPYTNAQAFGAYMAFCVYSIWLSRRYLVQVGRRALGLPSTLDDSGEPVSYRWAVLGAVLGSVALIAFAVWLGMALWIAIAYFIIYFGLAVAITRMRAELGTPVHDLHFTGPDWTMAETLGTRNLDAQTLTAFTSMWWFNRAYRSHPMPHQLEAFKLADHSRSHARPWFGVLVLASGVGALAGFWAMLHLNYRYGAVAKSAGSFGGEAFNQLSGWLKNPTSPNWGARGAIVAGFAIACFLQAMRVRFPWWPFHPLGFAVTSNWEINLVWMPLFIAWAVKLILLRYSGLAGFRRSIPFFIGLIMGQFVVGSVGNIIGILLGIPTYQFWQ